jgi:hypothetical protein
MPVSVKSAMALDTVSAQNIDRFFTAIKSLNELDKREIRSVVNAAFHPTERETYVTLNYHRAAINIEHLLTLTDLRQFQTITMIARSVLETAVEMRLMTTDPDFVPKIRLFIESEKLRSAQRVVAFKAKTPTAKVETTPYVQYIAANEQRIIQEKASMWPGASRVSHWSLMSMEARCKKLGLAFEELYEVHYAQMSWYVHSGVTGVANATGDTLSLLCGVAFDLVMRCYAIILELVINEFKIYHVDEHLKDKLVFAKMLPFTDSDAERGALARALGLA